MPTINMLSSADIVKGQGVASAYCEQVKLVNEGLEGKYEVLINSKQKCDITHYHTINPEYFVSLTFDKKTWSNVGYVHFLPETVEESLDIPKAGKKIFYKYMIEFYKSMDYLVTVNPYFIGELAKYGIPENKVTYIPNFVSDSMFYQYSNEKIGEIKQEWKIPEDKFIVLGVGQVQTRKGVVDFIETAKKMPDVYFIWAGGFSFGLMTDGYKELKQRISEVPENVNFIGIIERENMNDIYNIADIMFLPSYSELFPMTILESMCLGKPILLRDLDIYPNILFDYYIKGNSVDEFSDRINDLKNNKDIYNIWSQKSFEGHKFYSKESVLKKWEDFYDRVYSESKEKIKYTANKKYFMSDFKKVMLSKETMKKIGFKKPEKKLIPEKRRIRFEEKIKREFKILKEMLVIDKYFDDKK